jgi:integrase
VAWKVIKGSGWLVRWRDEDKKTRSRYFSDEADADAFKRDKDGEALARRMFAPGWEQRQSLTARIAFGDNLRGLPADDPAFSIEEFTRVMVQGNTRLRQTTKGLYLRTIRTWIAGTDIGPVDIRFVTPEELEAWWAALPHADKPGAVNNAIQLLRVALRRAVKRGLRDDNPLERTDIRKVTTRRRPVSVLTTQQVEALADAANNTRDRLEILVMAYGGLRAGEVGGLRLQDCDWERGQVHVEQQVVRVSGQGLEITGLKTQAARRVVSLPRSLMEELRLLVDEAPPASDGLLFKGTQGGMRDSVRINSSLQRAAQRVGIKTHPHALRHTAVSMWIADGASPLDVQRMVGHTQVSMTLGQYGHLFSYGGADLAERMERRREQHRNGG